MTEKMKMVLMEFALEILTDENLNLGLLDNLKPYRFEDNCLYLSDHDRIEYFEYQQPTDGVAATVMWTNNSKGNGWELMLEKNIK